MELIYAALLLHRAGKEITEESVRKVAEAAGIKVDDGQLKALVVALDGVDIEKEIKEGAVMQVQAPVESESKKEEKKEEDSEQKAEEAAAGLGALFG